MAAVLAAFFCLGLARAEPTVLSDTDGAVSTVVLSLNSARRAALRNFEAVQSIVNALPADTQVRILTNDRSAFLVARNTFGDRVQFVAMPAEEPITIWPQDPFVVLQRSEGEPNILLKSRSFERAGDDNMADVLAEALGLQVKLSELHFEGGNIVADDRHVLIGANTIRYNAVVNGTDDNSVGLAFQNELGRPVLVIGPYPQPVAHIDMMMTPLGEGRMAVADASLGVKLVEQAYAEDPNSVAEFENLCHEQFFGHPSIERVRAKGGEMISPPELFGMTRKLLEVNRNIAPVLDGIARSLEQAGYRVIRIPFYFGGPESRELDPNNPDSSVAAYPMLTYNNVLSHNSSQGRTVYLPAYGWPQFDQAAEHAWQEAGFKTVPVSGLTISAMYGGALRCSAKVLERSPVTAP